MPDAFLVVPAGVDDVTTALWTPTEIEYIQSWIFEPFPGYRTEEGNRVFKHEFLLRFMGETEMFGVLAEEGTSEAHIEDMAASTSERSMLKIKDKLQIRGNKLIPEDLAKAENTQHRRDLAAVWRDFRQHSARRRASTNGKIYFPGLH